ncbi:MAG: DUF5916 domain-containing protein [Gemmatimonadales bacterium]
MLLLAALLAGTPPTSRPVDPPVHSGRAGQTVVKPPRLEGNIVVDGVLDEPQWKQAAVLTGFSEFTPVDRVAAADSTEVLVWYSSTALYVGVRAFDTSGAVHATLATRDHIFNDDNVQMYLSTFNDGRQAMVFAVNPFGVQADGALNESGGLSCGMTGCGSQTRQQPDLSQDFVWDSKGRVTPGGYEVEIRIPFKSIRFQAGKSQNWGINFLRVVQRSGQEQTWTMVKLAAASFLAQSGRLEGLTDLNAGHVLDVVPTVTSRVSGSPPPLAPDGAFDYSGGNPQFGGDLRYGITPNLTLHATAHPDFSQVESDVTQFSFDPRQAIRYPERRPFFLDGVEQFDAPFGLIYTRRIVQPVFASKVTGKVGNNQIGVLAAVDDRSGSSVGDDNPVYGIVRASHDLGPGSRIAATWTEQHDGPAVNRVVDVDGRVVVDKVNSFAIAAAFAHDSRSGVVTDAPIWSASYRRNGRNFRINYGLTGIPANFITRAGLVGQRDIASASLDHSYTWLFDRRAVEAVTADVLVQGTWKYDDFVHGGPIQNRYLHFNTTARLKGGWNVGVSYFRESFGYDSTIYHGYGLLQPSGAVTPFTGGGARLPNNDYVLSVTTPSWKQFDFSGFVIAGLNDENYSEWASGRIFGLTLAMDMRPTDQLRLNLSYNDSRVYRPGDGSRVLLQDVAVGTLEYQLSRAFQLRVISQYSIDARDALHDDSRSDLPIVIKNAAGVYVPAVAYDNRALQTNFLFTYLPNPGTVVYLGYGTIDQRPDLANRIRLGPVQSDFFVKLSYLWRMRG